MKIKYLKNIYLGVEAKEQYRHIKARLLIRKFSQELYFITLPVFGNELLEIYPSIQLKQQHFTNYPVYVVGLAVGKAEALKVATDIIDTTYKDTSKFAIKEYLNFGM